MWKVVVLSAGDSSCVRACVYLVRERGWRIRRRLESGEEDEQEEWMMGKMGMRMKTKRMSKEEGEGYGGSKPHA